MTAAFLAVLLLCAAVHLWLDRRQVRHVRAHRDRVPERFQGRVTLEQHRKAADYTVARTHLASITRVASLGLILFWTLGGGIEALGGVWPVRTPLEGTGFLLVLLVASRVLLSPLAIFRVFGIEQAFGFNRLRLLGYLWLAWRGTLVRIALLGPLVLGLLALIDRGGRLWWAYAMVVAVALYFLLQVLGPRLIAPLFHRFRPLRDGPLADRLTALLARTGFRSRGLFEVLESRRSAHGNAFLAGLGPGRRIVLFDTLRSQLDEDEIEAVVAHELGHDLRHHQWRQAPAGIAGPLVYIALLAALLGQPWFFTGLGVGSPSPHAALLLVSWALGLFAFPLVPVVNALSRRHEFEADATAARLVGPGVVARALVRVHAANAVTLTPDPLHAAWHASHPPLAARLAALGA